MSRLGDLMDQVLERTALTIRLYTPEAMRLPHDFVDEARAMGSTSIDPEHVLLAILGRPHLRAAQLLAAAGVSRGAITRELEERDRKSLSSLGLSFDALRTRVEGSSGTPGATPSRRGCNESMTCNEEVVQMLRGADRQATRLRHWTRRPEHLLLALLTERGRGYRLLLRLNVDVESLISAVRAELTKG